MDLPSFKGMKVARNGKEALEKLPLAKLDVVLMDIQMPVLDRFSATKQLRENGLMLPIPKKRFQRLFDEAN